MMILMHPSGRTDVGHFYLADVLGWGRLGHHEEACSCVKPEIADLLRRCLDGIGDHRAHFAELRAKDGCC